MTTDGRDLGYQEKLRFPAGVCVHKGVPHECKMLGRQPSRPTSGKQRVIGGCRPAGPPSFTAAERFKKLDISEFAGPGAYEVLKADDQLAHRRKRDLCLAKIQPYHYLGGSSLIGSPGFTMVGNNVMFDEAAFTRH